MNPLTNSKAAVYLATIFVAGAAAGASLTWFQTHRHDSQPASTEKVGSRLQDRLKAKLNLAPDQTKKLQPILDHTASELCAARCKALRETDQILCNAYRQIAAELNPTQKEKLAAFERERKEWLSHRLTDHTDGK